MKEEMVHIVDENDVVIDTVLRSKMRKENLLHRSIHILVFNHQGELFVHQRTFTKDLFPGHYDTKISGTVATESYHQTAQREVKEEIGIENAKLEFLFKYKYETENNRVFAQVYKLIHDGPFKLQEEEVISGRFMPIAKVKELIENEKVTEGGIITFNKYFQEHSTK